jgi:hypothetical protein
MSKDSLYVRRTCSECPWLRETEVGRFPPERYRALWETCQPGGLAHLFACHKTERSERACAGMLAVCGPDINMVRLLASYGKIDLGAIEATGPLYDSFDEMARANGYDPASDGR